MLFAAPCATGARGRAALIAASLCFALPSIACADAVLRFERGSLAGRVEDAEATVEGLTLLDLGDDFVPAVLRGDGESTYGASYVALANEQFEGVPSAVRAPSDRYLELYGISPSLRIVRDRLDDEGRHACHASIDVAALAALEGPLRIGPSAPLEAARVLEARLACDGLLSVRQSDGRLDRATATALDVYRRRHAIVGDPTTLDHETRDALLAESRELDFRALLRALRERVADAAGLVEDGSANGGEQAIVDRQLGPIVASGLPDGAPDRIGAATDAAARALGWLGPDAARAWFVRYGEGAHLSLRVAVRLPPTPAYHAPHMALHARIDRGGPGRRPALVLYARDGERDIALVRWGTTVGGVQRERLPSGQVIRRFKRSPSGAFVWRVLVAAPTWRPPPSTPDDELLTTRRGRPTLDREAFGPGYRSAFGLAMLVHESIARTPSGAPARYIDVGIRTHGTATYRSISRGVSHGCHRLYNPLAIRLAAFLMRHRDHTRRGSVPVDYRRRVEQDGVVSALHIETMGDVVELTPPVPVDVE